MKLVQSGGARGEHLSGEVALGLGLEDRELAVAEGYEEGGGFGVCGEGSLREDVVDGEGEVGEEGGALGCIQREVIEDFRRVEPRVVRT